MRDALSLLDQCSAHSRIDADAVYTTMGLAGKRRIEELFEHIIAHKTEAALKCFSGMWMNGKDPVGVLGELFTLLRDTLMLRVAPKGGAELISGGHELAVLRRFAEQLTTEELCAGMGTLQDALISARAAKSPRSSAELCLVTLCSGLLKLDMPDFNARLSRLEEEIARGLVSAPASDAALEPHRGGPEREDELLPWEGEPYEEPPRSYEPELACEQPASAPETREPEELEVFREEQPEDVFFERPTRRAEQAASPKDAGNVDAKAFWSELCSRVAAKLPADMRIYPGDENKLRGRLDGGVLRLEAESGFVFYRFNRAEILQKFSDCAGELTGRTINTVLGEIKQEVQETRSLEELKRFPETHVIG